jgi:hypothetical protein
VKRHHPHSTRQTGVIGNRHSAFAGCNSLVGVEGETAYFGSAFPAPLPGLNRSIPPGCGEGVRRILDDPKSLLASEGLKLIYIHHHSTNVDCYDSDCTSVAIQRIGYSG